MIIPNPNPDPVKLQKRIDRLEAALKTIAFQGYEIPRQIAEKALKEDG